LLLVFLSSGLAAGGFVIPVSAGGTAQIYTTANGMMVYSPSMPVWNIYAASNFITSNPMTSDMPMYLYAPTTNALIPVLASKYVEYPSKGSLVVYLRKGLQWFNGSTTLPFTAWDVYTEFYIGAKVFDWYLPFLNASNIHLLNNYTIEFVLKPWSPTVPYFILTRRIATPYSVWKPFLENITAMNATQAKSAVSTVERFVAPPWFLGPYYTTISVPYGIMHLDPPNIVAEWDSIFPYHTWQDYNPEIIIWWSGGNGQTMNGALAGTVDWSQTGFSPAQFKILEGIGFDNLFYFPFGGHWIYIFNPDVYPFNITQVREALAYAQNYTEAADAWDAYGIEAWGPAHRETLPTCQFPDLLDQVTPKVYYDPAKAAALLESVGFTLKNGQWYMPNGQPFKISILMAAGWTDVDTMASNVASQWTAFGIPTQIIAMDPTTLYSTTLPSGDFTVSAGWSSSAPSYATLWTIGNWWWSLWYTSGYPGALGKYGWNEMANYPITFPNGTKGVFNMTAWYAKFATEAPLTAAYNQSILEMQAFFNSYWPFIPFGDRPTWAQINARVFNITWILDLSLDSQGVFMQPGPWPGWVNADNGIW